ncbi:unnamed protein product [Rotaria socialis]|uniref:Uncharacterized protein n=1 Tax=Rotaria socialis TaxID=392032 RepID=A0A818U7A3_9BILA|nr:unnamed protein product [Rotaria socialis]CAF4485800.1 unnamed protein product [Rotaria socialis]
MGGMMSWKPVSPNLTNVSTTTIKLKQTYSWVSTSMSCLQVTGTAGNTLVCPTGCSSNTTGIAISGTCIDYDFGLSISTSLTTQSITYQLGAQLVLAYRSTSMINLVAGSKPWSIATYINLAVRNDTEAINSSPTANMTPVVVVPVNTQQTLRIPMTDSDYDVVKCRWASNASAVASTTIDECSGVCQDLSGAKLYTSSNTDNNCTIVFNTSVVGYYCIAIQIEDFMPSSPNGTALSSIPLQFLVRGVQVSCGIPTITGEPTNGDTLYVQANVSYSTEIFAQTDCNGTTIIRFLTVILPSGLASISSIITYSSILYSTTFTWTPSNDQIGKKYLLCTIAVNSNNLQSTEYCLNFVVIAQIAATASNSNNESFNLYLLFGILLGIVLLAGLLLNILSYWYLPRWLDNTFLGELRRSFLHDGEETSSPLCENQHNEEIPNKSQTINNSTGLYRALYIKPDESSCESGQSLSTSLNLSSSSQSESKPRTTTITRFLTLPSTGITPIGHPSTFPSLPERILRSQPQRSILVQNYFEQHNSA